MEQWVAVATASAIAKNAAEVLGMLALAGALAGVARWPDARRRDFLAAFVLFLFGTFIAQLPVYIGGMVGWGADLVLVSAGGRIIQNVGALLFVRAALRDHCGPWGWVAVLFAAGLAAAIL